MPIVGQPISAALVEIASTVTGGTPPDASTLTVLQQLDAAGWRVGAMTSTPEGLHIYLPADAAAGVEVMLPGFGAATVVVRAADVGGQRTFEVITAQPGRVDVVGLELTFRFDSILGAAARVSFTGWVRVEASWRISFVGGTLAVEGHLAGADLAVSLDALAIVLSDDQVPPALAAANPSFRGFYAATGTIRVVTPATVAGVSGFTLPLHDVAIGPDGLRVPSFDQTWNVTTTAAEIVAADLRGTLLNSNIALALQSISGEIVANSPEQLTLAGVIQVPVIATVFSVTLRWRRGIGGSWELKATATTRPGASLAFGLVRMDSLALDGVLSAASLALSGNAVNLRLDPNPLALDVTDARVDLLCTDGGQSMRVALASSVALGPLTAQNEAAVVVRRVAGASDVTLEMHWTDAVIAAGGGNLRFDDVTMTMGADRQDISAIGQVTGVTVSLPPVSHRIAAAVEVQFSRVQTAGVFTDALSLAMTDVPLGCLGPIGAGQLTVEGTETAGGFALERVQLAGTLLWERMRAQLELAPSLAGTLQGDASLNTTVTWSNAGTLLIEASAGLPDANVVWAQLPATLRPATRDVTLAVRVQLASASGFPMNASLGALAGAATGSVAAEFQFRLLPPLAATNAIRVETVDPDGFVNARVSAGFGSQGAFGAIEFVDVATISLNLPALPQPTPVATMTLRDVSIPSTGPTQAVLEFGGDFVMGAAVPPAPAATDLAARLSRAIAPIFGMSGTARLRMTLTATRLELLLRAAPAAAAPIGDDGWLPVRGTLAGVSIGASILGPWDGAVPLPQVEPGGFEIALRDVAALGDLFGVADTATLRVTPSPALDANADVTWAGGVVQVAGGEIRFGTIGATLHIAEDGFDAAGTMSGVRIQIPPMGVVSVETAALDIHAASLSTGGRLTVSIALDGVPLGSLGSAQHAQLTLSLDRATAADPFRLIDLSLEGTVAWGGVRALLRLPANLPFVMPTFGVATAAIGWSLGTPAAVGGRISLAVETALDALAPAWHPVA